MMDTQEVENDLIYIKAELKVDLDLNQRWLRVYAEYHLSYVEVTKVR